jgi:hypothetical protein
MRLELGAISNRSLLQSVLDHQITLQEQRHQQEQQRQEKADFEETVEAASDMLEGLSHLGDHKEYAKRWLLAEAQLNPQLLEAWQHRRDSPEHQRHAVSTLKRAFKQMQKSAARMPDPEATEDRAAVTAAVRGSSRSPQPERAPDYSRMTQNELDREWEKHGA